LCSVEKKQVLIISCLCVLWPDLCGTLASELLKKRREGDSFENIAGMWL
jgi:hypothetical protein